MRPPDLKTKIFLDGGDPNDTRQIISLLGFLDGQTTNPTLIAKNPAAQERLAQGKKFTKEEVYVFYKNVVQEISSLIPNGSISIEVYADATTSAEEMLAQGREMFSWIPNAHVKFPTTKEGLKAAEQAVKEGLRVNITLCFSQSQAAAVYAATTGAKKGEIFVSPFVGRLDDRGENGMDLIRHIIYMYRQGGGHVEVLTASVRNLSHLLYAVQLGSDIITAPFAVLKEWADKGWPRPAEDFVYESGNLRPIPYQEIDLHKPWTDYDIAHELTEVGIDRFAKDWNTLIKS